MCFAGLSARFRPASSAPRRALVSSDTSQMPIYCTVKNRRTANRVAFYAAIKKKHSRKFAGSETASLRMRNGATTKHKGMSEPRRSKPTRPGVEERKGQRSMSAVEHAGNPEGATLSCASHERSSSIVRPARKIQFGRAHRAEESVRSRAMRMRSFVWRRARTFENAPRRQELDGARRSRRAPSDQGPGQALRAMRCADIRSGILACAVPPLRERPVGGSERRIEFIDVRRAGDSACVEGAVRESKDANLAVEKRSRDRTPALARPYARPTPTLLAPPPTSTRVPARGSGVGGGEIGYRFTSSTRRFFALPSSVSLLAIGADAPMPCALSRSAEIP